MQYLYTICDNCSQNNIKCGSFRKKGPKLQSLHLPQICTKKTDTVSFSTKKAPQSAVWLISLCPHYETFFTQKRISFNILEKKIVTENNK